MAIEETKVIELSDVQLVRAAQKDRTVMEELLNRLFPRIHQVAWAMVRTQDQAEEIRQAALLQILKYIGKYRGEGSLESWAGEITFRTGCSLLKRSSRWHDRHALVAESPDMLSEVSPDAHFAQKKLHKLIAEATVAIPDEQRTAFFLHVVYEYTMIEVSKIMKTSVNTTKYRLKAASKEMRNILTANPAIREAMLEVKE